MALDRYIFFSTTQPWFGAKPLSSSFDTTHYKGDTNLYRMLQTSGPLAMSAIVKAIKNTPQGESLPTNKWMIDGGKSFKEKRITAKPHRVEISGIYALRETMILMDALNRLAGRKFCSVSNFAEPLTSLNDFFRWNGKVFVYDN